MCTKKFLKVFGLLLVVGLLFAVAPTGQALAQTPTGYEFVQREAGTAAISTEQFYSSNSSVKFTTGEVLNNNDAAMIRFKFPDGFTLDELTALNYWEYVDTRENDLDIFLDIWLDFNGDGVATTDDYPGYMQAEPYYVQGAAPLDTWTYVDGMTLKWSTLVGPDDPYNAPTIAQLQANTVPTWTNNVDFGQLDILQIDIRVGYGYPTWNNFIGYADDITINGHVESFPPNEVWVCPTGSCGHTGAEFSTIQGGINAVAAGGTVNVAEGTYNENLTINKALTLQGAGDDVVTVNGVAPTTDAGMVNIVASNVTIDGFKFVAEGYKTIRLNAPSTGVTFSNNTVIGAPYTSGGGWILFESNYNNAHSNLTITGNVFENHGGQIGVYLNPQITGLTFTNNTFQGDPTSGPVLGIDGMLGTEVITGNTFTGITSPYALFEGFGTVPIMDIFDDNTWPTGYIASGKKMPTQVLAFRVVPASVVYPSTNDINRTNGWAHVDFVSADADAQTMTFNFVQTRNFFSCVEYRTSSETSPYYQKPNYNLEILDGLWRYTCSNTTGQTPITIELGPDDTHVEFRLSFGAEKDERFYWTPFAFVPEAWVDDDYTAATPGWGVTHFATIQDGIDAVAEGGTVNVAAGTYTEQVVINKSLTLEGAGAESTIIVAPDSPTSFSFTESGSSWQPVVFAFGGTESEGAIFGEETIEVTISGFTIDGDNRAPTDRSAGILLRNAEGVISGNTVRNMYIDGKQTFGIAAYGDSDVVIWGNNVSGYARGGIAANGDSDGVNQPSYPTPHAIITGNTVTGPGMDANVTWAPNGIQIGWGATGKVTENTVSGNGWPGTDWTGTGILVATSNNVEVDDNTVTRNETGIAVSGYMWNENGITASGTWIHDNMVDGNTYGISIQDKSVNTTIENNIIKNSSYDGIDICNFYEFPPTGTIIQGNTITGNNTEDDETSGGIWVDEDVNGNEVSINFNKIVDNNRFGVINASTINTIDATNNWWGCNAGPGNSGCDTASENVDYDPWVVLKIISEKQIVEPNETIQIDANLIHNSDEENTLSDGYVPDGIEAEFSVQSPGVVNPDSTTTIQGQVSTTFTSTGGGVFNVCVAVDNQTVCTEDIVVPAAAAVADAYRMMFNSTLDVDIAEGVTKNDTGITEGFGYTVSLVSGPTHGQLQLKTDGSFKYIPEADFVGDDSFVYQLVIFPSEPAIANENPWMDQATVTISVEAYQIFIPLVLK